MGNALQKLFKERIKENTTKSNFLYVNGKKFPLYTLLSMKDIFGSEYDNYSITEMLAANKILKNAVTEMNLRMFHGKTVDKWCFYSPHIFLKKHMYINASKDEIPLLIGKNKSNVNYLIENYNMPTDMKLIFVDKNKRS